MSAFASVASFGQSTAQAYQASKPARRDWIKQTSRGEPGEEGQEKDAFEFCGTPAPKNPIGSKTTGRSQTLLD